MYNLIYTVPFTNVDGEALTIQILEDGGTGTPVELTGGTPPFIVDVNDEDFLYNPTRFSGATLKLVGSDYLQKLFSTQYQRFKVNLVKAGSVIWTGFITPELYSQDYDNNLFELKIECISALSTLEYIDFKDEGATITLMDIIKKCITESKGDFRAVYMPNTYTSSLNGITVSTANFIDEDGKAMPLKECLEEVCKFLNWAITEYDGIVYFIDMDYIKAGKTSYTNIFTSTTTTLSSTINLRDIPSKGNNNQLSILGGYNRAVVIDSDYEADKDSLYPESNFRWQVPMYSKSKEFNGKTYIKNFAESEAFEPVYYAGNSTSFTKVDDGFSLDKQKQRAGTFLTQVASYDTGNKPVKLNYEDLFEIKQYDDYGTVKYLWQTGDLEFPVIRTKTASPTIVFDTDTKLCIDFKLMIQVTDDWGLPIEGDSMKGGSDWNNDFIYIPAKLRIGDYYYNGTSWTANSDNYFKLYTDCDKNKITAKWLNARNTNNFTTGYDELTGTLINIDKVMVGDLELTLYSPKFPNVEMAILFPPSYMFIKDISLQSQRKEGNTSGEKKDTKYENVVNESYINALDDITFKITSKNNSELSFSKAIVGTAVLDTLVNTIDNTSNKPEEYLIKRIINQYKQPKVKLLQVIKPEVQPYSIITDSYLSGKRFVFAGGRINYEDNSIECNLIELN